jgi:hypothetical protein
MFQPGKEDACDACKQEKRHPRRTLTLLPCWRKTPPKAVKCHKHNPAYQTH